MSQPPYPGQDPGYIPGGGPAYGSGYPPPGPGFGPPPRRGRPWWVWMLFGCGGCAMLAIIGTVVAVALGVSTFKSTMQDVGAVSESSVRQSLGTDLPAYPNAQLDLDSTKVLVATFRMAEKVTGKPRGSIFQGAALYRSSDSAQKVMDFYDKTLEKEGWRSRSTRDTGIQQHQYQKANGVAIIQAQKDPASGGTQISVMRGGAELVELNRRQGGGEAPAPAPAR